MKFPGSQSGFALVLVLFAVVVAATMAVLFLGGAARERRGVELYANGSAVRHLAGISVNRVIGHINLATKENTAEAPVSWASQPGMIRTYRANGQASNVYKLYSWDASVESATAFDPFGASQTPPGDWEASPARFTDLNQPIDGVYPIVDPRAEGIVAGFSVDETAAAVASSSTDAPMPVTWLYVLEDGQVVAPTGGSGNQVTVVGATVNNPIVGRIAYWTDDETSKVNLNTASEGTYWDWPKSGSRDDMQFAGNPPVKGEFQRIAGHPAMTSLSAAFPELLAENSADPTQTRWTNSSYRDQLQAIYGISPRIQWGGSLGGTYPVDTYTMDYAPERSFVESRSRPEPIEMNGERLYVSADDAWFQPDRNVNLAFQTALSGDAREFQSRLFFVTANSRAPETTLFETPRVSLWPITWPWVSSYFDKRNTGQPSTIPNPSTTPIESNPWMTAEERLLAFCSTLNVTAPQEASRYRFYFQRQNPDSPTHDWANIPRNQELVQYVSRQMKQEIPGWGASLASKWNDDTTDWISLSCFDYTRALVNQVTIPSLTSGLLYSYTGAGYRRILIGNVVRGQYVEPNAKTVTPLRVSINGIEQTTLGAYPVLREVALMFYATDRVEPIPPDNGGLPEGDPGFRDAADPYNWENLINVDSGNGYDNGTPGDGSDDVGSRTTEMRAVIFLDFSNLGLSSSNFAPVFWVRVTGASFSVNGSAINLPATGAGRAVQVSFNPNMIIQRVIEPLFRRETSIAKTFSNSVSGADVWTLVSDPIPVDPNALEFSFSGGPVTVEVFAPVPGNLDADPTGNPANLVMRKEMNFGEWDGTHPIPIAPRWNSVSQRYVGNVLPDDQPDPTLRPTAGVDGPATGWAYTEYVPRLGPKSTSLPSPDRNLDSFELIRNGVHLTPYVFLSGPQAGYVNDSDDPEDMAQPALRVSTNLRKRVMTLPQRNNNQDRAQFYLDGLPSAPVLSNSSSLANRNVDFFLMGTDSLLYESPALISPYDTVLSMVEDSTGDGRISSGPFRRISTVLAGQTPADVIDRTLYPRETAGYQFHALGTPGLMPQATGYQFFPTLINNSNLMARTGGSSGSINSAGMLGDREGQAGLIGAEFGVRQVVPAASDWTTMPGASPDGAMLMRPDQEYQQLAADEGSAAWAVQVPYFERGGTYGTNEGGSVSSEVNYFSPNRQIPSPVILGTIPSSKDQGWQTLLFSPNPSAGSTHPGLANPPDHLLLDLFWMPVAEPYPISDQFSTAGKVNLNYGIMPFSYIERKTGLFALLKSTWITALEDANAADYKSHFFMRQAGARTRFAIDIDQTLADFDAKFAAGDVFRSASQLCEMFLVPKGESLASVKGTFWQTRNLTADNAREEPYNHLYSRVTTKSNTFTVHWRAQLLSKPQNSPPNVWDESQGIVNADLRGSTLIERYLDPNATDIPDYATDPSAEPLSRFYKWRTVSETFFQP